MPFGLQAADNNYAVGWLAMMANQPWHGVPVMFALVAHDNHFHPWAITAVVDSEGDPIERPSLLATHIDEFDFSALPEPEQPIMAVGFMRETYLGERDGTPVVKARDTSIGDHPDDVLVRRVVVAFAGGGVQSAVHVRTSNVVGVNDAIRDDYQPGLIDQMQRILARLNTGELPR